MPDAPTSFDWEHVYAQERAAIREPDGRNDGPNRPLSGLAFSGGGIRSATFNLGIIQALAELKLLRQFDYLSCVSGGGYIGGWLSAFIHLKCNGRVEDAESMLTSGGVENPAIRFLRKYSNYLTPKASLFSADTLTGVATYLRNLHISLPMLLLTLSSFLLLPRLLVWFARWLVGWEGAHPENASLVPLFGGGILFIFIAMLFIGLNLGGRDAFQNRPFYTRQSGVLILVVLPGLLSAWLVAYGFYVGAPTLERLSLLAWVMWGMLVYVPPWLAGWALGHYLGRHAPGRPQFTLGKVAMMAISTVLAGALGGLLLAAFSEVTQFIPRGANRYNGSWIASALGTPVLLYFYSLTVIGHIGLMGSNFSRDSLEWWSRLGGWFLVVAAVWMTAFCLTFFAPTFILWVDQSVITFVRLAALLWIGLFATAYITPTKFHLNSLTGFITTVLGILQKPSTKAMEVWYALVASYIPYVVVIGLLGLLSFSLHRLLMLPVFCNECLQLPPSVSLLNMLYQEAPNFQHPGIAGVALLCAGSLVAATALASRIDINRFSIHDFFRHRLTRCYLGAPRSKFRSPNPFTGFDPRDDLKLADLYSTPLGKPQCQCPYPIFNTAMNLVAGKQLAWQKRHTAAFVFTPMATGYSFTLPDEKGQLLSHYRPTAQYMESVWMGSAMAISGAAAASPNMGYHSSPAVTFLMTVFNVRIGHWSPNPADEKAWTKHDPPFSGTYLLKELFGNTQYSSPFVHLSDGGHFENLGIYELVRRRCACIVAIDVGEDSNSQHEDLGNAINKCYADFGVVIDVNAEDLLNGYSAVGRITYPDAPPATLIYIKPRLIGTEPADLLICKSIHRGFPLESTADQGFDESEFEGYRKLGHYIGKAVFHTALIEAAQRQEMAGESGPILPWLCEIIHEQRCAAA
ncbi:MAG: hypothetical protein Q8K12_04055 [Thiobacillus sp.]|nr:hypothetical protein [Thiobacillus sp.]